MHPEVAEGDINSPDQQVDFVARCNEDVLWSFA